MPYPTLRDEDSRPWLEIRRTLKWRQQRRNSRSLAELVGITLVLVVSIATACWIGSEVSLQLSGVAATVESLAPPRGAPEHRIVGYTCQGSTSAVCPQPGN